MNRGDRGEPIFRDDEDRQQFISTLGEAYGKTGWAVQALCLMPNHFHLAVETPRANLVAGMKWLGRRAKGDTHKGDDGGAVASGDCGDGQVDRAGIADGSTGLC